MTHNPDAPDSIDPLELEVADLNELLTSMRQAQEELEAQINVQRSTIVFIARERDALKLRVVEVAGLLAGGDNCVQPAPGGC